MERKAFLAVSESGHLNFDFGLVICDSNRRLCPTNASLIRSFILHSQSLADFNWSVEFLAPGLRAGARD